MHPRPNTKPCGSNARGFAGIWTQEAEAYNKVWWAISVYNLSGAGPLRGHPRYGKTGAPHGHWRRERLSTLIAVRDVATPSCLWSVSLLAILGYQERPGCPSPEM